MTDRLSTGIEVIDRHMRGGIPVGSLLAFAAPPESQSDLLVSAATTVSDTHYISALRSADAIEQQLHRPTSTQTELTIQTVTPESFASNPAAVLDAVPQRGYVIVDGFEVFERLGGDAHIDTLRRLSARLRERESVGILHCPKQESRTPQRRRTLQFADVVWQLHLGITTLSVETRLTITKVRGSPTHLEPVKLKLSDTVVVDTSRDIA